MRSRSWLSERCSSWSRSLHWLSTRAERCLHSPVLLSCANAFKCDSASWAPVNGFSFCYQTPGSCGCVGGSEVFKCTLSLPVETPAHSHSIRHWCILNMEDFFPGWFALKPGLDQITGWTCPCHQVLLGFCLFPSQGKTLQEFYFFFFFFISGSIMSWIVSPVSPQNSYVGVLIPSPLECDLIWI